MKPKEREQMAIKAKERRTRRWLHKIGLKLVKQNGRKAAQSLDKMIFDELLKSENNLTSTIHDTADSLKQNDFGKYALHKKVTRGQRESRAAFKKRAFSEMLESMRLPPGTPCFDPLIEDSKSETQVSFQEFCDEFFTAMVKSLGIPPDLLNQTPKK